MAEAFKEWIGSHSWTGSADDSSTTATVMMSTILILTLCTAGIFLSSVIRSLSLSWTARRKGQPPLPPGSMGLPIFGETAAFVASRRAFTEARHAKYGPVFKSNIMGKTVFLPSPGGNKFLFANEPKLVQMSVFKPRRRLVGDNSIHVQKGDAFKRVRRHIHPFLSSSALAQYVPRIEKKVRSHLAEFWKPLAVKPTIDDQQGEFELAVWDPVNKIAFDIIADLILSLDRGDADTEELRRLLGLWTAGLIAVPLNVPGTAYYRALKGRAGVLAILGRLMAKRRVEHQEGKAAADQDFLSYLLTQPDDSGELMSDEEMKDNMLFFLNAGHSTSSHVMTMTLRSIAKHPDVYERIKEEHDFIAERKSPGEGLTKDDLAEMKYTWCVIQETMRMFPPILGAFKETAVDVEYDGFMIPKGWKMYWTTGSHMDPNFFEKPAIFDPARFEGKSGAPTYVYAPFGGGLRICPGNDFAKMEMLVWLHCVLRSYKLRLVDPEEPVYHDPFPSQKSGTLMKLRRFQ